MTKTKLTILIVALALGIAVVAHAATVLPVKQGGTGVATVTDGGLIIGKGTSGFANTGVLPSGSVVIGDGVTNPTTLAAFTSSTGVLKHEYGGIEADISAITTGGTLYGSGAGAISILTAGSNGECLKLTAGIPDWDTCVAGAIDGAGSANRLAFYSDADTITSGTDFTVDGTSGILTHTAASSTRFSSLTADFGATATSSFLSTGALNLAVDLTVANGGTGASTLTGLLQGNGTGAITAVTGTAGQFPYYNGVSTLIATSSIFLATSGNVGIGTTTPGSLLSLSGSNTNTTLTTLGTPTLQISNSNTTDNNFASLAFRSIDSVGAEFTGSRISGVFTNHTDGAEAGDIALLTMTAGAVSEKMRITGAGNVGISTTSPISTLTLSTAAGNTDGRTITLANNDTTQSNAQGYGRISFFGSDAGGAGERAYIYGVASGSGGQADITFGTAGSLAVSEKMRITQDGLFGFGTTTPFARFSIAGDAGGTVPLLTISSSTAAFATSTVFHITSQGLIGVASSSPLARFSIKGAGTGTGLTFQTTGSGDIPSFTILDRGSISLGSASPSALSGVSIGTSTTISTAQFAMSYASSTTAGATETVNWENGNTQRFILDENTGIVLNATSSNPRDGAKYLLKICQDATGSRTLTFLTPGQLVFSQGTTSPSSTANTGTLIGMVYDGRTQRYDVFASSTISDTRTCRP